ncbi:SDR family NAD(P)-dependent oxidoreductase [Herbiconiux sp. CPCC 205763]|uniref:SDR family NAD(P)-dependent oxidoreductase n=1 Tax=Herbiconiux aconitum TaxID=2970913 RepID=A0ABT2GSP9_9MICO|nr:SDR family NAD(P)-dependent oxidoreductase [Herbiconiux aconitum]MCS5719193.1 SDR family NAD(P)-dependent oxidoreductase [Herbiconiux aconitum]
MAGRTVVITGASDGIGAAAARELSRQGEEVVVIGRSADKTAAVAAELGAASFTADFARLDDVRELAGQLLARYPRIDVLANNAGGLMGPREGTVDGHEKTFQVNHLAPFLLTMLLADRLAESRATVIATSSVAHRLYSDFDIDDLESRRRYRPELAYGNAKLENILFTRELHKRFHDRGISSAAFHPGVVATSFSAGSQSGLRVMYGSVLNRVILSPAKGADTLVWLATTTPDLDWPSGGYFAKRKPARLKKGVDDPALAAALWDRSSAMVRR